MAKAGVLTIDVDAGTAKFLVDMDAANAKLKQFGQGAQQSGMHVVTSMQASSAAIRLLENPLGNNLRAVERFMSTLPGVGNALRLAFPVVGLIAFGDILARLGKEVVDFFKKMEEAPQRMAAAFRELNAPMQLTNDELRLANARLDEEIAKLQGNHENMLAIQLNEARVAADKLADSLDKDIDKFRKVLSENSVPWYRLFTAGNSDIGDDAKKFQSIIAQHTAEARIAIDQAGQDPDKLNAAKTAARGLLGKDYAGESSRATSQLQYLQLDANASPGRDYKGRIASLKEYIQVLKQASDLVDLTYANEQKKTGKEGIGVEDEKVRAAKEGYDRILAQMEMSGELMASERLKFRQEELQEITQAYGEKDQSVKKFEDDLRSQIGHLQQETLKEADSARDKDLNDEKRYQEEMARLKVEWAKKAFEANAALGKSMAELINRSAPTNQLDQILAAHPLPHAGGAGWGSGQTIRPSGAEAVSDAMALSKAGYKTPDEQNYDISKLKETLELMKEMNSPLGQSLDLREKILEAQIALGKEQGKDVSAQIIALGQLKHQVDALTTSADRWASFFSDMQNSAKRPDQIAQDGMRSAIDRMSASITEAMTGGKGNFGKAFQDIGRQMIQETIKSSMERTLSAMGLKLNKPTFKAGDPGHVIVDNLGSNPSGPTPVSPNSTPGSRGFPGIGPIFGGSQGGGIFNFGGAASGLGGFLGSFGGMGGGSGGDSGGGDGLTESVTSSISFGGAMADGGDFDPGSAYMVGENGPEMIVPRSRGTVIPNGKFGGGGDTHYHIDARGATDPTLTAVNVRRAVMAAHSDAVSTSVQAQAERQKRTPQRG